ncbi:Acetylxylan esterase precursor [Posidoniimonas polymericola]|uniref:Acetylxylan esterase n=1 Tax=Posidoniimonas polymericola TaxID=2528002 RepID=A0A5C5YGC8_9BACT|nr:alpha/beta hydrolase [Posidoniimonas polymericola]TWT74430.1 Acetylxylan esterase precursor [Posidoniimonas polymericola]
MHLRYALLLTAALLTPMTNAHAQPDADHKYDVPLLQGDSGFEEQRVVRGEPPRQDIWVGKSPNSSLRVFVPAEGQPTAAVVICPGGGYAGLSYVKEGVWVAKWFRERGVAAGVLTYRTGGGGNQHPAPLSDAQAALQHMRQQAGELGYPADKVGVMGFSAGGHLAATASMQFATGSPNSDDEAVTSRPDFSVLGYPVITMGDATHSGSRNNLLGQVSDEEAAKMSADLNVTDQTPPTFIFHAQDDGGVPVENALLYFRACTAHGVPAEMHLFERGGHGFGMWRDNEPVSAWPELLEAWMVSRDLMGKQD